MSPRIWRYLKRIVVPNNILRRERNSNQKEADISMIQIIGPYKYTLRNSLQRNGPHYLMRSTIYIRQVRKYYNSTNNPNEKTAAYKANFRLGLAE